MRIPLSAQQFSTVLHATNGPEPEALPRMWAELAPLVAMAGLIGHVQSLVDEALPPAATPGVAGPAQLTLFGAGEEAA